MLMPMNATQRTVPKSNSNNNDNNNMGKNIPISNNTLWMI